MSETIYASSLTFDGVDYVVKDAEGREMTNALKEEVEQFVEDLQGQLGESTGEILNHIKDTTDSIQEQMNVDKTELNTHLTESTERLSTELDTSTTELKTRLTESTTALDTKIDESTEAIQNQMTTDSTNIKARISSSTETLKTQMTSNTSTITTKIDESTEAIQTQMSNDTSDIKLDLTNKFNSLSTGMMSGNSDIKDKLTENTERLSTELDTSTTELKTQLSESTTALDTKIDESMTALESKMVTDTGAVQTQLTENTTSIISKINDTKTELSDKITTDVANLSNQGNINTETLKSQISESTERLSTELDTSTTELKTQLSESTTALDTKIDESTEAIQNQLTSSISDISSDISTAQNTLSSKITTDVADIKSSIDANRNTLSDKITTDVTNLSSEISTNSDILAGKIDANNADIASLTAKVTECFQSVSDGKATLATSLTNLGVTTASDAKFSVIDSNIKTVASNKYNDGVIATKKGTATVGDVLVTKTFTNSSGVELTGTMPNNGAISTSLGINGSYTIPAGYHNGSGKVTQNITTKSASTYTASTSDQTISAGQYLSGDQIIKAVSISTPTAGNILTGSSISVTSNGTTLKSVSGSMPNNGAVSSSLNCGGSYTIPAGYHNGSGKVTANSLSSQTSATAYAGIIRSGYTAWVNGSNITGTLPDMSSRTSYGSVPGISANYPSIPTREGEALQFNYDTNGTARISLSPPYGYYPGNCSSYINRPASEFGGAYQSQVLSGCTFTSTAGLGVSGTMPNNGAVSSSLNCGGSYTIPAGYHNGSGKVTANSLSSQTSATASSCELFSGKTAYVNGSKITGSAIPGFFAVIGGDSGTLQYTTDGSTWNTLWSGSATTKNLAFYSGLLWIATSASAGGIYNNGLSGTIGESITSAGGVTYSGLACGNGKVIVVNSDDSGVYYHVPWTSSKVKATTLPTSESFRAVYGHAGFILIRMGTTTGYKLNSSLGISDMLSFPIGAYDIAYGNGRYVMVGGGGAYYSTDGVTWVAGSTDGTLKIGVVFGNGKFVAVGRDCKSQYSYDGATWYSINGMGGAYMEAAGCSGQYFIAGGWYYSYYKLDTDGSSWVSMSNHGTGVCGSITGVQ